MEINGVITNTTLTPKAFAIECELVYEGTAVKTAFAFEFSEENIAHMLAVAGAPCWEQIVGKPVKLRVDKTEDEKVLKLNAVGHFLVNEWMTIEQPEEEKEIAQGD